MTWAFARRCSAARPAIAIGACPALRRLPVKGLSRGRAPKGSRPFFISGDEKTRSGADKHEANSTSMRPAPETPTQAQPRRPALALVAQSAEQRSRKAKVRVRLPTRARRVRARRLELEKSISNRTGFVRAPFAVEVLEVRPNRCRSSREAEPPACQVGITGANPVDRSACEWGRRRLWRPVRL